MELGSREQIASGSPVGVVSNDGWDVALFSNMDSIRNRSSGPGKVFKLQCSDLVRNWIQGKPQNKSIVWSFRFENHQHQRSI